MNKYLSKWYIYLVSVVFVIVAFCIGVSFKCAPKKEEKIEIFIGAKECNTVALIETLNANRADDVITVNVNFHYRTHSNFTYIYSSFRSEMDIFILPSEYLKNNEDIVTDYSASIKKDEFEQYFGLAPTYYIKGEFYKGIKIYDSASNEGFLKEEIIYCDENYNSDYYLFFGYNSVNLGFLNDSVTDNALELVRTIINEGL